ncbi:MAG: S-layer homology domain-containing protein [Candidatus Margulisbacteria bacterium]|nr:S-layer homology domain-containing protein [Candidatus Margulisiibacteriota bacterium]
MSKINVKLLFIFLTLSLSFALPPSIRIISPLENNPIIANGKTIIFGEVKRTDSLQINNEKITLENGLFRIIIPEQRPGKKTYNLYARNNQDTTHKELTVVTLKTLLDSYLSPFRKEIEILLSLEIMDSYLGTDFFKPDSFITKADFVKTLIKINKLSPLDFKTRYYFKDLPTNHWAYEYIQTALNKKIIEPKEAGYFGTESFLSRKELVQIIKPLLETINNNSKLRPFIDINYNLAEEKLLSDIAISGYLPREWTNKKEIYPNRAITRAELAYILTRTDLLRERISKELGINLDLAKISTDFGQSLKSLDITFSPMSKTTFKITALSNTERKIAYIELTFSDKYHKKNILLADDGKGLDKIKGDNVFTSAINLTTFNKDELSYEYKMFNAYNLIEEANMGKINFSNGNLSIY